MRRTGRVDRKIDEWFFQTDWVSGGQEGDRHNACFIVNIRRPAKGLYSVGDRYHSVVFAAVVDHKRSSEVFKNHKGSIEASTYEDLYKKCEKLFQASVSREWEKIILVCVSSRSNYKENCDFASIEFSYAVCERSGAIYRQGDHMSRDQGRYIHSNDEDPITELPWSQELEDKLEYIKQNIEFLHEKLRDVTKSAPALAKLKINPERRLLLE